MATRVSTALVALVALVLYIVLAPAMARHVRRAAIDDAGAILTHFDSDGDRLLNETEYEPWYRGLFPHELAPRHEEDVRVCFNETEAFQKADTDRTGYLNTTQVLSLSALFSHMLIATLLPLCVRNIGESWGYGLLAAFLITLISLVGAALLPLKTTKLPLMHFFLALAVGALLGDALLHILPTVFEIHSHEDAGKEHVLEEQAGEVQPGGEGEHTEHSAEEELIERMEKYVGPSMVVIFTILALYFVEILIHHLTRGTPMEHQHSHVHTPALEEGMDHHSHGHVPMAPVSSMPTKRAKRSSSHSHSSHPSPSMSSERSAHADRTTSSSQDAVSLSTRSVDKSSTPASLPATAKSKLDSIEVHDTKAADRVQSIGWMCIAADALHNLGAPCAILPLFCGILRQLVDGLSIGIAFSISPAQGLSAAIAIALHELPKELGTFALLLHAGFSRKRALLYNCLSGVGALIGAVIGLALGTLILDGQRWILCIVVGSFLYIALGDIVPQLHSMHGGTLPLLLQVAGFALGFLVMILLAIYEEHSEPTCRFE